MTDPDLACPNERSLREYLGGRTSAEQLDAIAAHLRGCPDCVTRLAELDGADTALATAASGSDSDEPNPALERALLHLLVPGQALPAPPVKPAAGDRLGEYRLFESVGEGAMGTTFKAVHLRLDRVVALKVLRPDLLHDRGAVARFEREMRAIGRLQHPNIVQALDAGESGGFLYLAMELVPGETLSQRVRRQGVLPVNEACRVGLAAARALQNAHEHSLVHRDVKPSNLMVAADGQVKLLDLGLVRLLIHESPAHGGPDAVAEKTRISDSGGAIGTSDYMAPEQWRCSSAVDARADQYALGCTLFYLLIGRPPFARDDSHTPFDKMQLHLNEPPPRVRALRPEVPLLLERVIERLLAKDPAERFADMAEVAGHLEQLVAGEQPAVLPSRPRTPRSPRRLLPIVLGLLAVGGVTFGFVGCPRDRSSPVEPAAKSPPIRSAPASGRVPMTAEEAVAVQRAWAEYLGRPVVEPHPIGMRMVLIPPGTYSVGQDRTRVVVTKPFQLAETEVTVAQFRAFVEDSKYQTVAERAGRAIRFKDLGKRDIVSGVNWRNPGYPDQQHDDPVVQMGWDDAVAFCDWLGNHDGMRYRLPTEWEYQWACRAGMAGEDIYDNKELPEYAWYRKNAEMRPHPVGQLRANRWGLYDILGNVHEWAGNAYQTKPLSDGTILDPPGDPTDRRRPVCGGGFETRMPAAGYQEPTYINVIIVKIGFRVLREVPMPTATNPGR